MRTTLAVGLLGALVLLVALAFLARSWRALVLVVPIVLYLGIGSLLTPPEPIITLTRTVSRERAAVGQEVDVELRIVNEGGHVPSIEVFDNLSRDLAVLRGRPHVHLELQAREVATLAYTVVPRVKGEYALGPVLLRAREPLGLRFTEEIVPTETRVLVAPRMEDLRKVHVAPRRVRALAGAVRSRQLGPGLEFFSLRDYEPGDEIRRVNWKATARRDRLATNEYEAERSGDAVIILDARGESEVGPVARSTTELGVTATVSLAAKILETRNRVGLIVQRDVLHRVYPGYGRRQLYRIVDALVRVRPGGEWSLEHVAWILGRYFPPHAQIIIVSPLLDAKAVAAIADLRARGFDVLVVSPNPLEVERAMFPGDVYADLAYRVLRMERETTIQDLRQFADVVDWNPGQPLAVALRGVGPYPRLR